MKSLEEKIKIVKEDIESKFPSCDNTVRILLWDDGTDHVECRHGCEVDGEYLLHISKYYKNQLYYEVINLEGELGGVLIDHVGLEYAARKSF